MSAADFCRGQRVHFESLRLQIQFFLFQSEESDVATEGSESIRATPTPGGLSLLPGLAHRSREELASHQREERRPISRRLDIRRQRVSRRNQGVLAPLPSPRNG